MKYDKDIDRHTSEGIEEGAKAILSLFLFVILLLTSFYMVAVFLDWTSGPWYK